MGASPEARAQQAAKGAAEQALAQQNELRKFLEGKTAGYETKALNALEGLESITGTKISDYIPQARKSFETYVKAMPFEAEELGARVQKNFDPNLLGSLSGQRLASSLRQSTGEFTTGMRQAGKESSSRLYETLAAPLAAFTASSMNPAFNNLINPDYMRQATNPETVSSDTNSMRHLYNYSNVV